MNLVYTMPCRTACRLHTRLAFDLRPGHDPLVVIIEPHIYVKVRQLHTRRAQDVSVILYVSHWPSRQWKVVTNRSPRLPSPPCSQGGPSMGAALATSLLAFVLGCR